jgi:hypothetical protein
MYGTYLIKSQHQSLANGAPPRRPGPHADGVLQVADQPQLVLDGELGVLGLVVHDGQPAAGGQQRTPEHLEAGRRQDDPVVADAPVYVAQQVQDRAFLAHVRGDDVDVLCICQFWLGL